MSNIDKRAREKLQAAAAKAVDNFDPNMFVETRDVLALLDELEESERLRLKFQEANCELCQKLEARDAQIANLTAERDALREGEMGDAKHSNTRAAADIYFQLVEECEIPAGSSLVEYVSQLRECAKAGKGGE